MGYKINRAYCGANIIISSLGTTTSENYVSIMDYTTNISKAYGTNLCMINRATIDCFHTTDYTFAEQLSITAISDIVAQSKIELDNKRTLLIISTTKGNIECINSDFESSHLWKLSERVAERFNCHNKPLVVSNACISGTAAIIIGARFIEQGIYDNVCVLGVDVVSGFVVSGFNSFKSISPTICRPYDKSRDGLTLGEGCGAILLTNNPNLSQSKIIVSGGGISNDANHISGPSRTGDGLFFAIRTAMQRSKVTGDEVSFINAHGTGTLFNDEMESRAFDMASITCAPCNSLKPYVGHTLGASGVIETILSIEQMQCNKVFGVKGYAEGGTVFELNISGKHRDMELKHCLKTTSGFGGTNAALILSKESECRPIDFVDMNIEIAEVSHAEITQSSELKFADYIRTEYKALSDTNLKFFKMDDLSKLGYVTSCKLMENINLPYPPDRIGIVMANCSSSLNTDLNHQKIVDQHLSEGSSPAIFVYTLANISAAEIAIKHKLQGELSFFVSKDKDMTFLYEYSARLIKSDLCDAVLYGWCEMIEDKYNCELKIITKRWNN